MRKLRSDITHEGLARTPHRAFMRATELDDAAIQKPMIGVVLMKGEQTPCNMTHGFQVKAAKEGVAEAGGTPREFTTISHQRELHALVVEADVVERWMGDWSAAQGATSSRDQIIPFNRLR